MSCSTSIIGQGGENIKNMKLETGLRVHVENVVVPPEGGDEAEQVVM